MAESDAPEAQWSVIKDQKCELCDINLIAFKCLNCDEMVCDNCKKTHLRSKLTKGHKVVCLKSAEIYESNESCKKCPSHTSEDLIMFCNTCNCPICRECVTSVVHRNHSMVKVEEIIGIKEKQLSNIIKQANERSKKYENIIATITQNKLEFSMSIAKITDMVKSRNSDLKIKLDKVESDYIKELQHALTENKKSMNELEKNLQVEMADLNNLIQQCICKQKNSNIEMINFVTDVTGRLEKYRLCDPSDVACPPDLITRHIDDHEVKHLFGYLDTKIKQDKNPLLQQNINISSAISTIDVNSRLPPNINIPQAIPDIDVNPLLPPNINIPPSSSAIDVNPPFPPDINIPSASQVKDIKLVSSFPSEKSHIVTTGNKRAWLWSCSRKGISMVASNGKVIQDINTDFDVFDAAVSTSGDLLVTVCGGNKIKKLKRNKKFKDIYTADGYDTLGITITDTGNVLVGLYKIMDSKIVEITISGRHIRSIQHDTVDNKLLLTIPWSICININGDIIVADYDKVLAVNKSGTKSFIYDGAERKLSGSFSPDTIVTDKHGKIIISDIYNPTIHVLDKDGKLIQYLENHEHRCNRPMGIAVDSSGILWVCDPKNKKVFKICVT